MSTLFEFLIDPAYGILYSDRIQFKLTVKTSLGPLTIPKQLDGITLNGRQSKVIVTDYTFGKNGSLLYCTANILFAGAIGDKDVIFLYKDRKSTRLNSSHSGESRMPSSA